jgi:tRNA nucleotidyltransferase (CCA-adding enzyme)
MQIYEVGGAVRDRLLGLPVRDRDYVVVGATPEQMVARGYLPVGKDFPVFLHPRTHAEYALARTERKTAPGYKGFVFHTDAAVTLEQDLARRDLTINAIAAPIQSSDLNAASDMAQLVDPFNGQADLKARIIRHVGPAFAEDPVRILRVSRFAARFVDFSLAPETLEVMREMVSAGEVNALVAERIWQEISRGLMEQKPSRMLTILRDCGALAVIAPELIGSQNPKIEPSLSGDFIDALLDRAALANEPLPVRFACLFAHRRQAVAEISQRWRTPAECVEVAMLATMHGSAISRADELDDQAVLTLIERCDGLRRESRFKQVVRAALMIASSLIASSLIASSLMSNQQQRINVEAAENRLFQALAVLNSLDLGAALKDYVGSTDVKSAVRALRLAALGRTLRDQSAK